VQYRRAVRAARNHAPDRLADLLDRLSVELGVTDAWDESTAVAEEALAIWEGEGEVLRAGDTLAHLTRAYWRMARGPESARAADRALELLEPLGPTPELARALSAKAAQCMTSWRHEEAQDLATRAVALADQLDLPAVRSDALGTLGCVLFNTGGGWEPPVRQSIELALVHELHAQAGRNYANLIGLLAGRNRFADAFAVAEEGLVYSVEHDVGTYSRCIRGSYAQVLELTGRWAEADQALEELLALASSPENRIEGLGAAGRLAARRGQHARATELLDEAMASSSGTGETQFILGTRLACLEAAWHADLAEEVEAQGAELAALFPELDADDRGEVAVWLRRAGAEVPAGKVAGVWAVQLIDPAAAVAAWDELGCPFRAALAAVDAGGEAELRDALVRLDAMGASGTARIVRRMLRELGARSIPAGARSTTRANPHGLTAREQEILDRIVAGMGNPQIAADLVISPKTVEHHVSAILGKLGVADRREAAGLALAAGGFEDAVAEEAATGVAASAG
jgi:DNA-binding CsgD family transcriptional regulator/tetratricopeptide (TPR) repeat protein